MKIQKKFFFGGGAGGGAGGGSGGGSGWWRGWVRVDVNAMLGVGGDVIKELKFWGKLFFFFFFFF